MRKLSGIMLSAALISCHGQAPEAVAPAKPDQPAGPVGIDSIDNGEIRRHVETLAGDDYRGRETDQPGAEMAAAYVAARFAEAGLAPMPGQAGYLVPYQLEERGFDGEATTGALTIAGAARPMKAGIDFAPFYFSDPGTAAGEVVFAGYGISAPDLGYDDYAGLDVKGKWVLVLRHSPNEKNDDNPLVAHSTFIRKAMTAQKNGAIGMLLVTDPLHHRGGDDLRLGGQLALPTPPEEASAGETQPKPAPVRGTFVAVHISQALASELFAPAGTPLVEAQKALDAGGKATSIRLPGVEATVSVTRRPAPRPVTAHNVVGFLPGSDPALADQWIVIGGHYDHVGAFDGEGDTVFNGADDNASGTTGVMMLAKAFASLPPDRRPRRSLLFMAFSGEEKGLLGSRAAIAQKSIPAEKVAFMLNLDMIGRNPDKPLYVAGDGYATELSQIVTEEAGRMRFNVELGGTDYQANSDHHPFFAEGIPVLFFFTGLHEDYHQLTDHADKVAFDNMGTILRLGYRVIDRLAAGDVTPRFIHHVSWLGIAVQTTGKGDATRATITGVEEGSRAARLGFRVGDVITAVGGKLLSDPDEVGARFAALEPGSSSPVHLERAGAKVELAVERARAGYLGVMLGGVDDDTRKKLGLADDEGIVISGLADDGPAGQAGIQKDDILIRIAGHPVGTRTLGRHLARIGAGEKVAIVVVRSGARVKLELVLGARPEAPRPRP